MNMKTALKKAKILFGKNACVEDRGKPQVLENGAVMSQRFVIGRVVMGMFFEVKGDGESWEAAFAKHEAQEARDKARYAALRKGK